MTVKFEQCGGPAPNSIWWRRAREIRVVAGMFWVLAALLSMFPGNAFADTCGQVLSPPLVSVRAQVRPATHDFSLGILQITADPNLAVPHGLADFKYATGATSVGAERELRLQFRGQPRAGGGLCWWVTNLQITVTTHTKVYIAREVPKNSCLWKEVMRHEAKHVKIDQKLFAQLADTVRPKVVKAVSRSVPANDKAQAEEIFRSRVTRATDEAIKAFVVKRNKRQLSIDTREEYTRANRICGNAEIRAAFKRAGIRP